MISANGGHDDVGSSKQPLEESNNSWDESMLTTAFDRQLKLVQKSLEPPPPAPIVPPASSKSSRSSLKSKTKENKREVQSEVKPAKDDRHVITHSSRKFRFEEPPSESSATATDSITKGPPTSTKSDQTIVQSSSDIPATCMMPPPFDTSKFPEIKGEDEARASMLMSWYMAGYHTGYFEATRKLKKST